MWNTVDSSLMKPRHHNLVLDCSWCHWVICINSTYDDNRDASSINLAKLKLLGRLLETLALLLCSKYVFWKWNIWIALHMAFSFFCCSYYHFLYYPLSFVFLGCQSHTRKSKWQNQCISYLCQCNILWYSFEGKHSSLSVSNQHTFLSLFKGYNIRRQEYSAAYFWLLCCLFLFSWEKKVKNKKGC